MADDLTRPAVGDTHPLYDQYFPVWTKLWHVYEGSGKFIDGTYLHAHPREWIDHHITVAESVDESYMDINGTQQTRTVTKQRKVANPNPTQPGSKLKARRRVARYENVGASIVDQKRSALFRQVPLRHVGPRDDEGRTDNSHPLNAWWEDVDGYGCCLDDCLQAGWTIAGVFGHAIVLMDRPVMDAPPKSLAEQSKPFLRFYSPLDVTDWKLDANGMLEEVAIVEAVQGGSLLTGGAADIEYRRRIVTRETFRVDRMIDGKVIDKGEDKPHGFGRLPVAVLYARRRALTPVIGQSVLGDPNLYIDLYNLTSEIRELERSQTFGQLNVQLGTGDTATSVIDAQNMLGQQSGTDAVLFTPGAAGFIQPDTGNLDVYMQDRDYLLRTIHRETNTPWESDTRDAESQGSLNIKQQDFYQSLAEYADELEGLEYEIAELWFRAMYGASWEAEQERAKLLVRWPDNFEPMPFDMLLAQAKAALALGMPHMVMQAIMRRVVSQFLPDASPEELSQLYDAIAAAPDPKIEEEQARKDRFSSLSRPPA
jgi:hypothetical protein